MGLHDRILITSDNRTGDDFDRSKVHPKIGMMLNFEFKKKLAASMGFPIRRPVDYKGLTRTYTLDILPHKGSIKVVI